MWEDELTQRETNDVAEKRNVEDEALKTAKVLVHSYHKVRSCILRHSQVSNIKFEHERPLRERPARGTPPHLNHIQ